MDTLPLHPMLVHLPIALAVLMPLVAAGAALAWWRGWLTRRIWFVALGLQTLLVVSSVLALRSGEAEEERVEHIVGESSIEAHEEAAEVFVWAAGGVWLLSLAGAFVPDDRMALRVASAATLATAAVFGLGYQTGAAGGELVYGQGAAAAYVSARADGSSAEGAEGGRWAGGLLGGDDDDDDDDD